MPAFTETLARHGLHLERGETHTLQVNVGLLCNQVCRHCHLDAGPSRPEVLSAETMEEVVAYARRARFSTIDVTGGAPELVPCLPRLLESMAPLAPRLLLRSNLTALAEEGRRDLVALCRAHRVVLVASLPSTNPGQTDAQRGPGVWDRSLAALRWLNEEGYGRPGTGLELDLVANPAGAFLAAPQEQTETKFRRDLARRWGVEFNRLFSFSNVPLGRFRAWLEASGNLDSYLTTLTDRFNPCTLEGLMCRSLVSVSWDGSLFDCDFNLAQGLYLGGRRRRVSELDGPPAPGGAVVTGDHCYACTAGAGFT
ncbi:MAG: arsenosugar biosynthesis radical SAM protein ArsS [Deltaproteobacteria bacterium]|nr:arsenosugar biosynthesis radical SAM protein ArsS [Deltaproteobacteria bacterium]